MILSNFFYNKLQIDLNLWRLEMARNNVKYFPLQKNNDKSKIKLKN